MYNETSLLGQLACGPAVEPGIPWIPPKWW